MCAGADVGLETKNGRLTRKPSPPLPTLCEMICRSDFGLLGQLGCIVDFDAQATHRAFKFAVAEQQIAGSEVLGALVDTRQRPRCLPAQG